ncbi:hypothetical protein ABW19_dt0208748 [Dactylella cylindrospora]|nr:hypothetical protein ABW19_dt0208748 [Dactylella cylindrospora]
MSTITTKETTTTTEKSIEVTTETSISTTSLISISTTSTTMLASSEIQDMETLNITSTPTITSTTSRPQHSHPGEPPSEFTRPRSAPSRRSVGVKSESHFHDLLIFSARFDGIADYNSVVKASWQMLLYYNWTLDTLTVRAVLSGIDGDKSTSTILESATLSPFSGGSTVFQSLATSGLPYILSALKTDWMQALPTRSPRSNAGSSNEYPPMSRATETSNIKFVATLSGFVDFGTVKAAWQASIRLGNPDITEVYLSEDFSGMDGTFSTTSTSFWTLQGPLTKKELFQDCVTYGLPHIIGVVSDLFHQPKTSGPRAMNQFHEELLTGYTMAPTPKDITIVQPVTTKVVTKVVTHLNTLVPPLKHTNNPHIDVSEKLARKRPVALTWLPWALAMLLIFRIIGIAVGWHAIASYFYRRKLGRGDTESKLVKIESSSTVSSEVLDLFPQPPVSPRVSREARKASGSQTIDLSKAGTIRGRGRIESGSSFYTVNLDS